MDTVPRPLKQKWLAVQHTHLVSARQRAAAANPRPWTRPRRTPCDAVACGVEVGVVLVCGVMETPRYSIHTFQSQLNPWMSRGVTGVSRTARKFVEESRRQRELCTQSTQATQQTIYPGRNLSSLTERAYIEKENHARGFTYSQQRQLASLLPTPAPKWYHRKSRIMIFSSSIHLETTGNRREIATAERYQPTICPAR